jgi:hypothetical protein
MLRACDSLECSWVGRPKFIALDIGSYIIGTSSLEGLTARPPLIRQGWTLQFSRSN